MPPKTKKKFFYYYEPHTKIAIYSSDTKNCYLLFRDVNPKTLLKFFLVITGHVFAFVKALPRTDLGMALYVKTHSNMNLDRSGFLKPHS